MKCTAWFFTAYVLEIVHSFKQTGILALEQCVGHVLLPGVHAVSFFPRMFRRAMFRSLWLQWGRMVKSQVVCLWIANLRLAQVPEDLFLWKAPQELRWAPVYFLGPEITVISVELRLSTQPLNHSTAHLRFTRHLSHPSPRSPRNPGALAVSSFMACEEVDLQRCWSWAMAMG